jgi:hypothetical protein
VILHIRCTDRAHRFLARRRVPVRIIIAIPRRDAQENPLLDRSSSSRIHSCRAPTAQAEVRDNSLRALSRSSTVNCVVSDEVDACDHAWKRARAAVVEDLDAEEESLFSDADVAAANGTGYVRAVAVPVGRGRVDEVGEEGRAAAKLLWELVACREW